MKILWNYLKVQKGLVIVSLLLATMSQLLNLVDPIIFGKIIDDYASNPSGFESSELVRGVLFWLAIAIGVALVARAAKAFQRHRTVALGELLP